MEQKKFTKEEFEKMTKALAFCYFNNDKLSKKEAKEMLKLLLDVEEEIQKWEEHYKSYSLR